MHAIRGLVFGALLLSLVGITACGTSSLPDLDNLVTYFDRNPPLRTTIATSLAARAAQLGMEAWVLQSFGCTLQGRIVQASIGIAMERLGSDLTSVPWRRLLTGKHAALARDLAEPTAPPTRTAEVLSSDERLARSNGDVIGIENGLSHRKEILARLRQRVQANPTDLSAAVDYYRVQIEILIALLERCLDFHKHADKRYGKPLRTLMNQVKAHQTDLEVKTRSGSAAARKGYESLAQRCVEVEKAIDLALRTLEQQRLWTAARGTALEEELVLARYALKTAQLTKDVKTAIEPIRKSADSFSEPPAPLIIFQINPADFTSMAPQSATSPGTDDERDHDL